MRNDGTAPRDDDERRDDDGDRTEAEPTDVAHSDAGSQAERNREDESPS